MSLYYNAQGKEQVEDEYGYGSEFFHVKQK